MNTTHTEDSDAVAGQVERPVRPWLRSEKALARRQFRYYTNHIDSERQQPKQYGNGAQGQKGNDESRKCQVPGGTQR